MNTRDRTPFGSRMLIARKRAGLTQIQVQKALGVSQSTLSGLETEAHSSGKVVEYAMLYRVNPHWLATGEGDMDAPAVDRGAATAQSRGVAQNLSYQAFTVPPLKTREDVLSGRNLGELFTYTVTDDATRDSYPRGLQIIFRTTGQPKIGKAVLVAHGDQVHVRIYGQGKSAGEWAANAEAPGYLSFNSEDGSVIKGYYKGQIESDD